MLTLSYTLSTICMLLLPVALAILLRRRYQIFWILFTVGGLTFLGAQIVHLPLNEWLMNIGVLPGNSLTAGVPLLRSAVILGLTAGLCEELARAVGYAIIKWARRFEDGVMLGLGHGGIEAMIFGGVLTAATISSLINLQGMDLESLNLTAAQLETISLQMELFDDSLLFAFAPFVERSFAIGAHVLFSILVLQAFTQRKPLYILTAIVYHAVVDGLAVYVAASTQSIWATWATFLIVLFPGWIWLFRIWRARNHELKKSSQESHYTGSFRKEIGLFIANLRKELFFQWRTFRMLILCAVLIAFGIMSPLLTKFTPQFLSSIEGAEIFAELIPEMTITDSINQHIETITQFGFILVILFGMGAVAGEKEQGTAAMVLSKPLSRASFLNSKFVAQSLIYLLAFGLSTIIGYYYTTLLFGDFKFSNFMSLNLLLLLWILVFTSITLLGSTLGSSTGAAAGFALGFSIFMLIVSYIPRIGTLLPSGLLSWAGQIGSQNGSNANWGAVTMSFVVILFCLISSLGVFERQELQ